LRTGGETGDKKGKNNRSGLEKTQNKEGEYTERFHFQRKGGVKELKARPNAAIKVYYGTGRERREPQAVTENGDTHELLVAFMVRGGSGRYQSMGKQGILRVLIHDLADREQRRRRWVRTQDLAKPKRIFHIPL